MQTVILINAFEVPAGKAGAISGGMAQASRAHETHTRLSLDSGSPYYPGQTYAKLRSRSSGLFSGEIKSGIVPSLSFTTHLFFSFIAKAGT
jgi:hypothetical protein